MVVGGDPSFAAFYDVELIDLSGQARTCRKPENIPQASRGSVGAYFAGRALVCGGVYISDCYYYNTNGTWTQGPSMTSARGYAAATFINHQFSISGGDNQDVSGLNSTELLNSSNNSFDQFVDMPVERFQHNIVSLDVNRAIFLGGQDFYSNTYLFNGSWSDGPTLSIERFVSQAGLVTFDNGTTVIVVAGGVGEQTTELLVVDDNI